MKKYFFILQLALILLFLCKAISGECIDDSYALDPLLVRQLSLTNYVGGSIVVKYSTNENIIVTWPNSFSMDIHPSGSNNYVFSLRALESSSSSQMLVRGSFSFLLGIVLSTLLFLSAERTDSSPTFICLCLLFSASVIGVTASCTPVITISIPVNIMPFMNQVSNENDGTLELQFHPLEIGVLINYDINSLSVDENKFSFPRQMTAAALESASIFGSQYALPLLSVRFKETSSSQTALELAKEFYSAGIRLFVGPLTSAEAFPILEWANSTSDAIFISPSATSSDLSALNPNFIQLVMSNQGRAEAYNQLLRQQFQLQSLSLTVHPILSDESSSIDLVNRLQSLLLDTPIQFTDPILYTDVTSEATANPSVSLLAASIRQTSGTSLVFLVGHEEVQFVLESAYSYPELSAVRWFSAGFDFSPEVISSPESALFASLVGLNSAVFISSDQLSTSDLRHSFDESVANRLVGSGNRTTYPLTPLISQVYDSFLLYFDALRLYPSAFGQAGVAQILLEAASEYGFSGHLRLNHQRERIRGSYVWSFVDENGWQRGGTIQVLPIGSPLQKRVESSPALMTASSTDPFMFIDPNIIVKYCDPQEPVNSFSSERPIFTTVAAEYATRNPYDYTYKTLSKAPGVYIPLNTGELTIFRFGCRGNGEWIFSCSPPKAAGGIATCRLGSQIGLSSAGGPGARTGTLTCVSTSNGCSRTSVTSDPACSYQGPVCSLESLFDLSKWKLYIPQ